MKFVFFFMGTCICEKKVVPLQTKNRLKTEKSVKKSIKHLLLPVFVMIAGVVSAQQNTSFRDVNVTSPIVNDDHTVTFRVRAPHAENVRVLGDWASNGGELALRNAGEYWEATTEVLPSEMYMYRVEIDGVIGLDPTNPFVRRDVGTQFSIFYVTGGVGDYYLVRDVPHGSIIETWYPSVSSARDRRMSIYTPPSYGANTERYPVLYLLHGSGGDETAWVDLGHVARIMDNLIAEGKIEPMLVVMPNGNFAKTAAPGETSENLNYRPVMSDRIVGNYKDGQYELAFGEIIQYVESHYRVVADKHHRAIAGLSMGGFHTLHTALLHPDSFDYIGLFSAGLNIHWFDLESGTYAHQQEKLQRLQQGGFRLFWIAIGSEDFLYEQNVEFRNRLDQIQFPYEYHESTRGHMWCNWRQYLIDFSQKLWK